VSRSTFDLGFLPIWIKDGLSISVRFFGGCDVSEICTMCEENRELERKLYIGYMVPFGRSWAVVE